MATLDEIRASYAADKATNVVPTTSPTVPEQTLAIEPQMSPLSRALGVGAGGLLGAGDVLTLGGLGNVVAAGAAVPEYLSGIPFGQAFAERKAQTAALKNLYRQAATEQGASVLGIPLSEAIAGFGIPTGAGAKVADVLSSGWKTRALANALLGGGAAATTAGLSVETPEANKAEAIKKSAFFGSVTGGLASALGSGIEGLVSKASKLGERIQRSSIGATATDYGKMATRYGIKPEESTGFNEALIHVAPDIEGPEMETLVKRNIDELIRNKELGKSRDPNVMLGIVDDKLKQLTAQVNAAVTKADKTTPVTAKPDFANAINYIEQRAPFNKRDTYLKYVVDLENDINTFGRNALTYVQGQKRAIAKTWSAGDDVDAEFGRAVYSDLQKHIEKYAPEVAPLNAKQSQLMTVVPILRKGLKKQEAADDLGEMRRLAFTTGGIMAPVIAGGTIGAATGEGTSGAIKGAIVGGLLRSAVTPSGKQAIGESLTRLGGAGETVLPTFGSALRRAVQAGIVTGAEELPSQKAQPTKATRGIGQAQRQELIDLRERLKADVVAPNKPPASAPQKTDVAAILADKPAIIRAIAQVESRGKAGATSKRGAQGVMQLMPNTAKALGVKNSLNAAENIAAGERYYNQLKKRFGDTKLALAAYNWGQGNVSKALAKVKAKGKDATWENVLKHTAVPVETRQYVTKVLGMVG